MKARILILSAATMAIVLSATTTFATNGMNLEGYGPEATAMGGASMAFDNGTAAVINNPATLSLMEEKGRIDLALGMLGPDITVTNNNIGESADSQSNAFFMPAFGYAQRHNDMVFGFGVFGQGGMGCKYDPDSWRGLGYGLENMTEISVGRAIVPFAIKVTDKLHLAATVDFVWAGLDLKMAMTGDQFFDMIDPTQQHFGQASGSLVQSLGMILQQMPPGTTVDYAYFDFTNSDAFTGEAKGTGWGGKIGVVYEASSDWTLGLTYHMKTDLGNLSSSSANISFQMTMPDDMGTINQTVTGDIDVVDFQWPAMLAAGVAYRPNPKTLLVFDLKQIYWASVMDSFRMGFTASDDPGNGPLAGQDLYAELYQDWDNQLVFALGGAYQINDQWTLRAGYNYGDNPVPSQYLNCLFPAIVQSHLTAGFGWAWNDSSSIDFSAVYGFKATDTSGYNVTVEHSQLNFQIMYSYRFGN
jgi:long-chain fatty acid transport protein